MGKSLSARAKLELMGVQLLPVPLNPVLNLFDMHNTKEMATVICGIVNTAVNKKGVMGYLGILPDLWPAYQDADMIDNELLDMNEEEFVELKTHIQTHLTFEGSAEQLESISENIAVYIIGIVVEVIKITRLNSVPK